MWVRALGFSGVNFCLGIRFLVGKSARALRFGTLLTKKYVKFNKE